MTKSVKTIASIALPIALSFVAPGIGTALGSTLSAGTLSTIGGAVGGAISGGIINKGGLAGAALGGLTGAAASGIGNAVMGTAAGTPLAGQVAGKALQGPTLGTGIKGAITGGGARALGASVTQAASGGLSSPLVKGALSLGNQFVAQGEADTAEKAAKIQAEALDRATATQAPYNALGTSAAQQIQQIQADPGAYVQNNPFYKSLADDAERRLLANQAAKGKVGSGGTANELQTQLLNLGNGLVQQQVGTLQNQVNSGQTAASNVSTLQRDQGEVQASGQIGKNNALSSGYQNQIDTLLALQSLQKTPSYSPSATIRR